MQEQITFHASLEAVSAFTQMLEERFQDLAVAPRTNIVLAMQELCVNIVKHAYAGADGAIVVDIHRASGVLQITVTDDAQKAFEMPDEITAPDAAMLPENGMGLFIIHQAFDSVRYSRRSSQNVWELRKQLGELS